MAETLRTSARLSLAVLASRVLGVAREATFAALFGAGQIADAYQVAFRIPNLLRDLFAEGALSSAFIPTFTAVLARDGQGAAHRVANLAVSGVLMITGTLSVLGIVFAEGIVRLISAGFAGDDEKLRLAVALTRVMMPLLSLVSLAAVWMGMLNAQRRYLPPAYAPVVFNVGSVAVGVTLLWAGSTGEDGVYWWSVGTLVAGAAQALMQLPWLWHMGYRPLLHIKGLWSDPAVRRIVRLMTPAIIGLAAVQINIFINTRFAADLGDGPVGYLAYAFRLFYLPVGLFGVALATVTTTRVAEDAARGDRVRLAARAAEGMAGVWLLTSASAVGLLVLAEPVVALVYQRGAFARADTVATAWVLRAYLLGLVPYALIKILAPAFYSIDRPKIPLLASIAAVTVNVTFNALTYRELGAPGIALGTALGALSNVVVLRASFGRVIGPVPKTRRVKDGVALLVANAILAGAVWSLWQGVMVLRTVAAQTSAVPDSLLLVLGLALVIGVGFLLYVGCLYAAGFPGAKLLWELPKALLRRLRPARREKPPRS